MYEEAIRADPTHVNRRVNVGVVYDRLGNRDAALRCWREALEIDPAAAQAHANPGSCPARRRKRR